MTIEIERRFLPANDGWRAEAGEPELLAQGYLSVEKERTIRVRIIGSRAWLTLKGYISDITRSEYEYEIPLEHAREIMDTMCPFTLEKHRYTVRHGGFTFEIDEYFGANAPLVREITADGRYTNAYLSKHPYSDWTPQEREA